MRKIAKVLGNIEDWATIITFASMIVIIMVIVLCRYVFHVRFTPGEEIARYLMIWCGYAGAALGFREHSHVGVVVFSEWFPKKVQPYIIKLRHILSCIIVLVLLYTAVMCFDKYLQFGSLTVTTRIPMAAVYIIIPIALAFGMIHTITDIMNDFSKESNQSEDKTEQEVSK